MYLFILFGACFIFSALVTLLVMAYAKSEPMGTIHVLPNSESDEPYLMLSLESDDVLRKIADGKTVTFIVNDMRKNPQ